MGPSPSPSSSGPGGRASFPWQGLMVESRPLRDPAGTGVGGTAGPHGLRDQGYPSQGNTRVFQIFFQVFMGPAHSHPPPQPSLLVLGRNQFGWGTAHTLVGGGGWRGRCVESGWGWESFPGFVTCQQLAGPPDGKGHADGDAGYAPGQRSWSRTCGQAGLEGQPHGAPTAC